MPHASNASVTWPGWSRNLVKGSECLPDKPVWLRTRSVPDLPRETPNLEVHLYQWRPLYDCVDKVELRCDQRGTTSNLSSKILDNQQLPKQIRSLHHALRADRLGKVKPLLAISSEAQRRRLLYMSVLARSIISLFIRYWSTRSTIASGCASTNLLKSEISSPPRRASLLRTWVFISTEQIQNLLYSPAAEAESGHQQEQIYLRNATVRDR